MHLLLRDYLTNEQNKASVNERSGHGTGGSPALAKANFLYKSEYKEIL